MTAPSPHPLQPGEISEFKCDFCGAYFETEAELSKHEQNCKGDEIPPGV